MPRRLALLVATYDYRDEALQQLTAPGRETEVLAEVLRDPDIADFDVTVKINEPHHVVGQAIGEFYHRCRRDDLTLLYFTGHGLKDDQGRLYLAMTDTRHDQLLFTGLSANQINEAMESSSSRQNLLILDCSFSGTFPVGGTPADSKVHTLQRFDGQGRVVLTTSDAIQYSFEGEEVTGEGPGFVFTRFLAEGLTTGDADLDGDGNIALDELFAYAHDRVVAAEPRLNPQMLEHVEGQIVVAQNVNWALPDHIRHAVQSPFKEQRLAALEDLKHLHVVGNERVRTEVVNQTRGLAEDDSKSVSMAASELLTTLETGGAASQTEMMETEAQARRDAEAERARRAEQERDRREAAEERDRRETEAERVRREAEEQVPRASRRRRRGRRNRPVPAGSPDWVITTVEAAVSRLVGPGRLTFNPPAQMRQGRKERVEVGVARARELSDNLRDELDDELRRDLRGRGEPQFADVKTSPFMTVLLRGDGFDVTALSPPTLLVAPLARWEFDVIPQRAGNRALQLCVSMRITVPDLESAEIAIPVFEREIHVRVAPVYATRHLATQHWQWLVGTLAGLGAALTAWFQLIRGQ